MPKLRFLQFEIEAETDEVLRVALERSLLDRSILDRSILSREVLDREEAPPAPPSPAQTRAALPAAPAPEPAVERQTAVRSPLRKKTSEAPAPPARHSAPSSASPSASGSGSIADRILAGLGKGPRSSAELAQDLGLTPDQVYTPCYMLKKAGRIDSFVDDAKDGARRYRLVR